MFGGEVLKSLLDGGEKLGEDQKALIKDGLGISANSVEDLVKKLQKKTKQPIDELKTKCVQSRAVNCRFSARNVGGVCFLHISSKKLLKYEEYLKCPYRGKKK